MLRIAYRYILSYILIMSSAKTLRFFEKKHGLSCDKPSKESHCEGDLWKRHLPKAWQAAVDPPVYFVRHREYEISAERTLGYDADDRPCYTAHYYQLTQLCSDDDDEYYEVLSYSEELFAWKMRDERWLVYRRSSRGDCRGERGCYVFAQDMPR